jgi:hypothetical protein
MIMSFFGSGEQPAKRALATQYAPASAEPSNLENRIHSFDVRHARRRILSCTRLNPFVLFALAWSRCFG